MSGAIFVAVGGCLMIVGLVMLGGWAGGKSRWFNPAVFDRPGATKTDRLLLAVYFAAMVVAPLMAGAMLVVYGLAKP